MPGPRFRVAIVGAGPSGLFAAQQLTARDDVAVDIFDRLPTPYGLLRYGVAPDHTSIKSVANALARVFDAPAVRFLGLVDFGRDVSREELLAGYDAVIYAVGASEDLRMGVPGEDAAGSRSAREFVAWYSGHPDAAAQSLFGVRQAVAVGVGNVAVDVARILAKDPAALDETDMPEDVLAELRRARLTDVWVIGRRGPQHASFTTPELRELCRTPGVQVSVEPESFEWVEDDLLDRRSRANLTVLREAVDRTRAEPAGHPRVRLHFLFWRRPVEVQGDPVTGLVLERTRMDADGRVVGTGETEQLSTQLVLRAIGYRAVRLPDVPFDEELGVIPSVHGRVLADDGAVAPREYVVGWIKRGPVGVIGTNKSDAKETVEQVLADLAELGPLPGRIDLLEALAARGFAPSTFDDWRRIEAAEANRGAGYERERMKIEAWHELLDLVQRERPGGPIPPD
ncbi:FAD-dependent oxidoreductase [Micropruina sonneratiae]|uniref:FAD-dependent oxidoreductase n=1 Tax=Micropruina sonneratiae TaxID=2986940 RepID=UPI002226ABB5|nr:FAD-dependent oxidoreductase [Micropruina sp. KQZ13P-5]MCW3159158.1 FAD-dependent oxidoreductase [Micropruina sp. KQZ13P-5]